MVKIAYYRVFSRDVTAAMLVYLNNGTAAIDLFADKAAILISIVSKDIMGCLPPGHPIIAI